MREHVLQRARPEIGRSLRPGLLPMLTPLINIFILLMLIGCFIDSVPALFLLTPLLVPVVAQ